MFSFEEISVNLRKFSKRVFNTLLKIKSILRGVPPNTKSLINDAARSGHARNLPTGYDGQVNKTNNFVNSGFIRGNGKEDEEEEDEYRPSEVKVKSFVRRMIYLLAIVPS